MLKETMYSAFEENNNISPAYMEKFGVKRGLRNADGTGVMAGVTNICNVHGYVVDDGEKKPIEGNLIFRGYNIRDIIDNVMAEERFGFEEIAFLLLTGRLPSKSEFEEFTLLLSDNRTLPDSFFEDMILKAPSRNIMNKMARSTLALYSYDSDPEVSTAEHEIDTAVSLIAKMPVIMICAYETKKRFFNNESMIMHPLIKGQSTAENILSTLRLDRKFTYDEAKLLDLMLMLHAEHGGGNNSTFTTHVVIQETGLTSNSVTTQWLESGSSGGSSGGDTPGGGTNPGLTSITLGIDSPQRNAEVKTSQVLTFYLSGSFVGDGTSNGTIGISIEADSTAAVKVNKSLDVQSKTFSSADSFSNNPWSGNELFAGTGARGWHAVRLWFKDSTGNIVAQSNPVGLNFVGDE